MKKKFIKKILKVKLDGLFLYSHTIPILVFINEINSNLNDAKFFNHWDFIYFSF